MRTALSVRRALAAVTATALLAGGLQLWAATASAADLAITHLANPVTQVNDDAVELRGTANTGDALTVTVTSTGGGSFTPLLLTATDNRFSATLDATTLFDGLLTVTVRRATGGEVVETTPKDTTGPAAPVLTDVTDLVNLANQDAFTVSGAAAASSTVTITVTDTAKDGLGQPAPQSVAADALVAADGTFTTSFSVASLVDDVLTVTAVATDSIGNSSGPSGALTADKDATAPTFSGLEATNTTTATPTTTIRGKTSDGDRVVTFSVSDGANTRDGGSTTAGADGSFEVSIDVSTLNDGPFTVTLRTTDVAGNEGSGSVGGVKDTDGPGVVGLSASDTSGADPVSSVVGSTDPGASVLVTATDGEGTSFSETVVAAAEDDLLAGVTAGDFSAELNLTTLVDGPVTVTAVATDTDGNTGSVSSTTIAHDLNAPVVPVLTSVTDPVNAANQVLFQVAGSAEPGASVQVTVRGMALDALGEPEPRTLRGTGSAGGDGLFNVTLDVTELQDGDLQVSVAATDAAGNEGAAVTRTVTKDTAAPGFTGLSATDTTAATPTTTIRGTTEPNRPVQFVVTAGDGEVVGEPVTADGGGSFETSIDVSSLPDGEFTVTVSTTDVAGNPGSDTVTGSKDATGPSISGLAATATDKDTSSSTVSGTTEPGASVLVTATDQDGISVSETVQAAAADDPLEGVTAGEFSVSLDLSTLADGPVTVSAVATDSKGNAGPLVSVVINHDDSAPAAPVLTSITDPVNLANQTTFTAVGTAEPGATVTVTISDSTTNQLGQPTPKTAIGTGTADTAGAFSITFSVQTLKDGALAATATASDGAGNVGPVSAQLVARKDTVAPTITDLASTDVSSSSSSTTVTGKASERGRPVTLSVTDSEGMTVTGDVVSSSAEDGTFTGVVDVSGLADGSLTTRAATTDTAGNPGSASVVATKDTVGPVVSALRATDVNQSQATSTVTGVTDAGASVRITAADGDGGTQEAVVTADDAGEFTASIDLTSLADGVITVTAVATDSFGNPGAAAGTTAAKDTLAPAAPVIEAVTDPVNAVTQTAVDVAGSAESGATVTVTITGPVTTIDPVTAQRTTTTESRTGTALAADTGAYAAVVDAEVFDDGQLQVTATAADAAGNTGATSAPTLSTKDTVGAAIADLAATATTAATPSTTISGSTEPGAPVTFTLSDGIQTLEAATTADELGAFTVECDLSSLADGTITVVARATDSAGNQGPAAQTTTSKDAGGPDVTEMSATSTNIAEPRSTITGAAETGANIAVSATDEQGARVLGQATSESGRFSTTLDLSSLSDGEIVVRASATDADGNTGAAGETGTTNDQTAPGAPLITAVTDPVNADNQDAFSVAGTSEAFATVVVTLTGSKPGMLPGSGEPASESRTTTADADGAYAALFDVTAYLDGELGVSAKASDPAGNPGAASATRTVTKDTQLPAVTTLAATSTTQKSPRSTVTGSTEPGVVVALAAVDAAAERVVGEAVADANGAFSAQIDLTGLSDGEITVTGTPTDAAGNEGAPVSTTTSKDATGPGVTELSATESTLAAPVSTVTGMTSGGAHVTLSATSPGSGAPVEGTATAGGDGRFTLQLDLSALEDGTVTVTATAFDELENAGAPAQATTTRSSTTPTTGSGGGGVGGGGTGSSPTPSVSPTPAASASPSTSPSTSPTPTASASPSGSASASPSTSPSPSVAPRDGAGYVALSSPTRVLDSRNGTGTTQGLKRGRVVLDLSDRIPAGATAAVLNVTVTNPTATGFVVAYPDGNAKPGTSNVNVVAGQTQANEVVVGLPASRRVVLFVDSTSAHLIADLVGFFTETERPDLGRVVTQAPVRVLDSREGTGTTVGRKSGEVVLDLTGKVPAGTTSVALNVTVAGPDARGFVVAFPTGTVRPGTSNVNFERGQTQANEVVVRLGTGAHAGKVSLFVDSATAALIADLVASVVPRDGAGNQLFTALQQPERVLDTRSGLGGTSGRRNGSISLTLPADVVPAGATGVVLNVTSTGASRTGFVSVYPAGTANPGTSNVNFRPGVNQANEVLTAISGGRGVTLFVGGGGTPLTHVVVDVVGYLTSTG